METLSHTIEQAYEHRQKPTSLHSKKITDTVQETIDLLNNGSIRVAEKINDQWHSFAWIKKAIFAVFQNISLSSTTKCASLLR